MQSIAAIKSGPDSGFGPGEVCDAGTSFCSQNWVYPGNYASCPPVTNYCSVGITEQPCNAPQPPDCVVTQTPANLDPSAITPSGQSPDFMTFLQNVINQDLTPILHIVTTISYFIGYAV